MDGGGGGGGAPARARIDGRRPTSLRSIRNRVSTRGLELRRAGRAVRARVNWKRWKVARASRAWRWRLQREEEDEETDRSGVVFIGGEGQTDNALPILF
ncbi:hypothetical protein NL676_014419 [Syzygium grande]|nr:hypothetical protein NL676_014419 [Syzygium grande]